MSNSSAPEPRSTKIGSRPMDRIARTGEFTPPGSTGSARRYSSAERVSVSEEGALTSGRTMLGLPGAERLREVEHAHLLELRRGVERRPLGDAGLGGDRVEHGVA